MKALFNFIAAAITTRIRTTNRGGADVPFFPAVELWRGQTTRERLDKTQNPYRTNAVFIEFVVIEAKNLSLGVINTHLIVRFRFALQSMKFDRPEDFDFLDSFNQAMQGLRGEMADPVQFSGLEKQLYLNDPDHDNVNEPVLEYFTIYREISGYKQANYTLHAPVKPDVSGEVLTP